MPLPRSGPGICSCWRVTVAEAPFLAALQRLSYRGLASGTTPAARHCSAPHTQLFIPFGQYC